MYVERPFQPFYIYDAQDEGKIIDHTGSVQVTSDVPGTAVVKAIERGNVL
jgi:hypothetical protein